MPTADYRLRTEQNVRDGAGTLWFGDPNTPGGKVTILACDAIGRPYLRVIPRGLIRPSYVAEWLRAHRRITILNIAGNPESQAPGIGERVERFLGHVFARLGDARL